MFSICFGPFLPVSKSAKASSDERPHLGKMVYPGIEESVDPSIAQKWHCLYSFAVLQSHLTGNPSPEPDFPDCRCALFVTWNTMSSGGHRLRGCIGTLEPKQLHAALHDYTLNSALRDHRFSPIKLKELPSLQCKVSVGGSARRRRGAAGVVGQQAGVTSALAAWVSTSSPPHPLSDVPLGAAQAVCLDYHVGSGAMAMHSQL